MNSIYRHWDLPSAILYVITGIICAICFTIAKNRELKTGKKQKLYTMPYIISISLLVVLAAFRYISIKMGGTDAHLYKTFFETCLSGNVDAYYEHYDILYKLINYVIRFFTSNYYIFAIIFYGFIATCFVHFVNEFVEPRDSKIPLILIFFLYLRGFNTYRTELTIAIILLSVCFYKKDKKIIAYILAFLTFFIHKASIIYALCIPFMDFLKTKKIKIKYCIALIFLAYISAKIFQPILINMFVADTTNAYSSYIGRSLRNSFFANFWKICFEQLVLFLIMILFRKRIIKEIDNNEAYKKERNIIWQLCIFDFIMIPITYILSIWRGYEYLYLPRLVMLGLAIRVVTDKCNVTTKRILNVLFFIIIVAWMVFRIYNTWEESSLLPYVFEPFYVFFSN